MLPAWTSRRPFEPASFPEQEQSVTTGVRTGNSSPEPPPKFPRAAPRPGEAFRNGKLYLFTRWGICVYRLWPQPRAWALAAGSNVWRGVESFMPISRWRREIGTLERKAKWLRGLDGVRPLDAVETRRLAALERRRETLETALATLPPRVLAAVARLPFDQWLALRAFAQAPSLVDLSWANPALLLTLLTPPTYGLSRRPPRPATLRRLAPRRQRDILGWLGMPKEESLARTFAKVPVRGLRRWTLRRLVAVARDAEARRRLSHLRRLSDTALWLLDSPERRAAASQVLLDEVARERQRSRRLTFAMQFGETLRMLAILDRRPPGRGYRSMAQVERAHGRMTWEALVRGKLFDGQNDPFPRPPYPGEDWIEPIRTPGELIREAEEQHNCVAAYIEDAREGDSSFYRVLAPQRATLELRRGRDGKWNVADIRTIDNGVASADTRRAVRHWLDAEWPVEVEEGPDSWDRIPWSVSEEPGEADLPD